MSSQFSRRDFVAGLGSVAAAFALPNALAKPSSPSQKIRFGYAAITWEETIFKP
jgi:hypothetical protein